MSTIHSIAIKCVVLAAMMATWQTVHGQDTAGGQAETATTATASEDAARQEILQSDAWKTMRNDFQRWLAIQKIYSRDEVTQIVNELNDRALSLSPSELQGLLSDMQSRLEVLLSPQADDARQWVSQYLRTGREQQVREQRPDVMSMSADQIRAELQRLEQRQVARQQSNAAFESIRAMQAQNALNAQAARQQSQQQFVESQSRAARNSQLRSPYAPRPQDLPNYTDFNAVARQLDYAPFHSISPWGTPIRWHPLYGYWW